MRVIVIMCDYRDRSEICVSYCIWSVMMIKDGCAIFDFYIFAV